MKISRIIFTSFFSLIGVFLLSLMFFGFIHKDKKNFNENGDKYETKKIELESFSHVYAEAGCKLNIYSAEKPSFSYLVEKEKENNKPVYEIKNDTLFIISTGTSNHGVLKLMTHNLKTIKANKSKLHLASIKLDTLSVSLMKTDLRFINKEVSILYLDLQLSDQSDVKAWNFNGNEVKMDIENSRCQMSSNSKLRKISGKIGGNSDVRLPKTGRLDLDIDESSSVTMH